MKNLNYLIRFDSSMHVNKSISNEIDIFSSKVNKIGNSLN